MVRGDANNSGLMSRRRRNGQRRNSCVMYARYAREAWDGSAWRPRGRGRRRWPPKQLERVRDGRVRGPGTGEGWRRRGCAFQFR